MGIKPNHGSKKWRRGGFLERRISEHGQSVVHFMAVRKNRKQFLVLFCIGATVVVVFVFTVLLELLAIEDDGNAGWGSRHTAFVREPMVAREAFLAGDGAIGSFNLGLSGGKILASTRVKKVTTSATAIGPPPANWWLLDSEAPIDLDPEVTGWKPVLGSTFKFYIYSAFYESRPIQPFIRVVGATKTKLPGKAWCRLYYDDTDGWPSDPSLTPPGQIVVQGRIKIIRENWNLLYSAVFILCPLPSTGPLATKMPTAVTIMKTSDAEDLGNKVKVGRIDRDGKPGNYPTSGLGVCVKPFYGNYKKVLQLMEFVEMNRVFGVSWFTFYNHSLSGEASCLLDYYVSQGVAEVLPWNFPFISAKEIRTEGIFAALNDCVYRNMPRSKYLALIDVDELIVPHQSADLVSTLSMVDSSRNHSPSMPVLKKGSFSFQNAFFYLNWPDDMSDFPEAWPLVILRKTRRKTKLNPHRQRSKYIVNAKSVIEVGNHFVWEHVKGHGAATVPPDVAMLHHYRQCEFGDDCTSLPSTVDRTGWKFLPKVFQRFRETLKEVSVKCRIDNKTLSESPRY